MSEFSAINQHILGRLWALPRFSNVTDSVFHVAPFDGNNSRNPGNFLETEELAMF